MEIKDFFVKLHPAAAQIIGKRNDSGGESRDFSGERSTESKIYAYAMAMEMHRALAANVGKPLPKGIKEQL